MPRKPMKDLPSNPTQWKNRVGVNSIQNASIHKVKLRSASTIQEEQFDSLRTLWKNHEHRYPDLKRFDLEPWVSLAQEMLDKYASWQAYVEKGVEGVKGMPEATLVMASYWQEMAAKSSSKRFVSTVAFSPKVHNTRSRTGHLPKKKNAYNPETPTKSTGTVPVYSSESDSSDEEPKKESPGSKEFVNFNPPRTRDEEIVTAAISNLLGGLIVHTEIPNIWTVHRMPFKAEFGHSSFVACVDGYLADKSLAEKVRALVEVKPMALETNLIKICMQVAAQMVAWIMSNPDEKGSLNLPGRRVHVSQYRNEIYITFAEYDKEFISYLNDEPQSRTGLYFLIMHQYGPWKTNAPAHMRELGKFLVAISLRAQFDMKNEEAEAEDKKGQKETDEHGDSMSVYVSESKDDEIDDEMDEGDDQEHDQEAGQEGDEEGDQRDDQGDDEKDEEEDSDEEMDIRKGGRGVKRRRIER